jgi:outer membrane lipoprotein-sorting protein
MSLLFPLWVSANTLPASLNQNEVNALVEKMDELSRFETDFNAEIFLQQKHREKGDLLYKMAVFRQDQSNHLTMLFLKPKTDAGKGYLVLDKNLFLYTPNTGDWTRVGEDRISGTDTNLADFDNWNLSEEYSAEFIGLEKLGKFPVYHLSLTARPGIQVKAQRIGLWIEPRKSFALKVQEYAQSGRLLRTTYRTKWRKVEDEGETQRYIPMETRIYDEVEKGNQTIMVIDKITLKQLPKEIFTKAWLEAKSR